MNVDDPVWNRLILKGYQTYEDFQYLMKNGFIERINKIDVPIYYQVAPNNTNHALPDEIEEIKLIQGTSYIRHRKFDNKITISRVWCKIRLGNNIAGHLVVLEAHRKFNDNDFFLIQKLSDAVALELQKRKSGNKLTREKYELLLQRLLEGEIRDSGSLEEKLKIFDLHFGKKLRTVSLNHRR